MLLVRVEETAEPGKRVPVIRQGDRARLERIGKLRERELGVGNEKHPLRCFEKCAAPTGDRGATRIDPPGMQLEARRADDAACIGGERIGRTIRETERSRLSRSQRGDGGVRGDDTVSVNAHRLGVGLAVLAKRSQTIATGGVASSPSVDIGRRCARSFRAFARRSPGTGCSR